MMNFFHLLPSPHAAVLLTHLNPISLSLSLPLSLSAQEEKGLQSGLTSPVALEGELQGLVLST